MGSEDFRKELETLINRHSRESGSDTPDFVLADFLHDCLRSFDLATNARDRWYGRGRFQRTHPPDRDERAQPVDLLADLEV